MRTLRETDSVKGESMAGKDSLLFGEELSCDGRVVREEKPDDDAGKARYGALDELVLSATHSSVMEEKTYEKPLPAWDPPRAVHVLGDDTGKES